MNESQKCRCGVGLTYVGESYGLPVFEDPTTPTIGGVHIQVQGGDGRCFKCVYEDRKIAESGGFYA